MINNGMLRFRVFDPREEAALREAAAQDNHLALETKFVARKGDEIVGAVGVCPSVWIWLHSQKCNARDALGMLNFYENQLGVVPEVGLISLPVVEKSPLYPFVRRVGYTHADGVQLFLKNLKG